MIALRAEPKARRAHMEMQWKQPPTLVDGAVTPQGDA
jgi:hypothetical protein